MGFSEIFRAVFRLVLVITLNCFASALLAIFGLWAVAIFTSVGFGFAGVAMMGPLLDEARKGAAVVLFLVFFLVTTAGIMATARTDHALWVNKVSGISLNDTPRHPHASVFSFRDGQARPDLMETADILGSSGKGGSHRIDTAFVVPMVPEGWTRGDPVPVWAVSTEDNYQEQSSHWKRSVRSGARTVGLNVSDYKEAIEAARSSRGLISSEDPLLLELSPNPEELVANTWIRLGWILWIDACLVLLVVFVGMAMPKNTEPPYRRK